MVAKARRLLEEALTLPRPERAALVGELLDTLDTQEGVEAAWTAELRRRLVELREGRAELIDWESARAELQGTNQ